MGRVRRCVVIDDDPDDLDLILEALASKLEHWIVDTERTTFNEFSRYFDYDLIILDECIGPFRGSEISTLLRRMHYKGGIVIVSGVQRSMEGFDAFVWKDNLTELAGVLDRFARLDDKRKD